MKMKLTVDKKECGKVFYNEILYISSKYPLLKKNPNTKAHSVTKVFSLYITIGFLMMVAFFLLYVIFTKWIFLVILLFMSIYFFLSLYFLYDAIKFVNKEVKEKDDSILTINNSGVRITRGKKLDYKIDFKDIMYVLINKNTIVFLPKEKGNLMIGVPSKYKKEIVNELKELKKDDLVIDNSKLYK